jgi:hypothetical protein
MLGRKGGREEGRDAKAVDGGVGMYVQCMYYPFDESQKASTPTQSLWVWPRIFFSFPWLMGLSCGEDGTVFSPPRPSQSLMRFSCEMLAATLEGQKKNSPVLPATTHCRLRCCPLGPSKKRVRGIVITECPY